MKIFVSWFTILIICGCHSVVHVQNTDESNVKSVANCGESVINCPNDERINVVSAKYATNSIICPDKKIPKTSNCVVESAEDVIRNRCQGHSKCTISSSDFGTDLCPDVSKYIQVNYTCEAKPSASCSADNRCDQKTEVCVESSDGISCKCAKDYKEGADGTCQAITCENTNTSCNATTQRCEDLNPAGIQCVCAEGYMEDDKNQCIAITCENTKVSCDATTQRCEDLNPAGIQCVCAEGYVNDHNNQCIAITCENANTSCNATTQRCEELNPAGIQCVCAEGYMKDDTSQCIAITCENTNTSCDATTQRCEDLNPAGIQCVCVEGYMTDGTNQCIAITCENTNVSCNATTQRCEDLNPAGIQCVCAEGYMKDDTSQCIAITCENTNVSCDATTQRCEDLHPSGIQCVCADGYSRDHTNQCIAINCENTNTSCDDTTQRCEELNPVGIQCVCAEGYMEDDNNQCIAITCENTNTSCDATSQRCEDLNPAGIECVCAEGFRRDHTNQCIAITCEDTNTSCDATTQRCEDLSPAGIQCVCAEGYMEDGTNQCIAITCENTNTSCDATTQRCEDLNPAGIQCVCAERYMKDHTNQCIAITCENTNASCNTSTQRCEDLNPAGIQCVCAEGYVKDHNNQCIEVKKAYGTTVLPENETRCPEDTFNIGVIVLSFPGAGMGEEVNSTESCSSVLSQNQSLPLATRVCNKVWQEPKITKCFDVIPENHLRTLLQLNLTHANVGGVSRSFAMFMFLNLNGDITAELLDLIINYLARIVAVGSDSYEVTDVVVGVVSLIMTVKEEILNETRGVSLVIRLMEQQVTNVVKNGQNYSQSLQNLGVRTMTMHKSAFECDFTFTDRVTAKAEDAISDEDSVEETSITIPHSVLNVINEAHTNITDVPISFVTYGDSRLFRRDENQSSESRDGTNGYMGSYVISSTVELPNLTIDGLPQNSSVIIKFSDLMLKEEDTANKTELLCVYWNYTSYDGKGEWSQNGCKKVSSGLRYVTCSCNHLTSFAVLVKTYNEDKEDTGVRLVLQLITIIGCSISIIGLFLSLMCMAFIRKVRIKQQTRVHFNLCLALIGLYLSFLLGIDQSDRPSTCRRMTSLIYFFCLSSMMWMSVEAFCIYKLIWRCKRNNIKHLIPVGALFAWVFPGIAAMVIYSVDGNHDYEADPDYCFLHPGPVLIYGFLLVLLMLFVYNSIVFILVIYRINSRKIMVWNREYKRRERIIRFKSTVLFWLLLGISWVFGFFATFAHPAVLAFQIIFCVLLSLQGFFMFYMLIVQNPEMRKSLSTISSIRTTSASHHLGVRNSSSDISSKERKIKGGFVSFDMGNNESFV